MILPHNLVTSTSPSRAFSLYLNLTSILHSYRLNCLYIPIDIQCIHLALSKSKETQPCGHYYVKNHKSQIADRGSDQTPAPVDDDETSPVRHAAHNTRGLTFFVIVSGARKNSVSDPAWFRLVRPSIPHLHGGIECLRDSGR